MMKGGSLNSSVNEGRRWASVALDIYTSILDMDMFRNTCVLHADQHPRDRPRKHAAILKKRPLSMYHRLMTYTKRHPDVIHATLDALEALDDMLIQAVIDGGMTAHETDKKIKHAQYYGEVLRVIDYDESHIDPMSPIMSLLGLSPSNKATFPSAGTEASFDMFFLENDEGIVSYASLYDIVENVLRSTTIDPLMIRDAVLYLVGNRDDFTMDDEAMFITALVTVKPDFDFHKSIALVHAFMDTPLGQSISENHDYIPLLMMSRESMEAIIDSNGKYHEDMAFFMRCIQDYEKITMDGIMKARTSHAMDTYISLRLSSSPTVNHDGITAESLIAMSKKSLTSYVTVREVRNIMLYAGIQTSTLHQRIGGILWNEDERDGGLSGKGYSMIQSSMLLIRILESMPEDEPSMHIREESADEVIRDYHDGLPYDYIANAYFTNAGNMIGR